MSKIADRSLGFSIATSEDFTRACKAMELAAEKFSRTLDKLDGKTARVRVEAETKGADAGLDNVERKRKDLDGKSARVKVDIDKRSFADAANAWALLSRNMRTLALPGGIALAAPTVLALGQAAEVSAQSLLLLPAAGAAAGAVIGTLKLGVSGLSDAFKEIFAAKQNPEKLAAALANLSPQARAFAVAVQSIRPAFDSMRMDVQDALFRNFAGTVQGLAGAYLPVLRVGLTGIAVELSSAAMQVAGFVREAQTVRDVQTIFGNTREAMGELSPAGVAILQILRDIAAVGSDFLPGLAAGFTEVAQTAAAFVARARETGQLREWISQGLSALGLLAQTFINVGGIVTAVFRALHSDSDAFLTGIRDLTARVSEFLNSAQGQQILVDIFTNLRGLASALLPLFGAVAVAVLQLFQQVAPSLPPLVKGITDVFNASGSLLGVFRELAVAVLPIVGAGLSALAPILGPLLIVITATAAAMKIYAITVAIVETATKAWAIAQAILNGTLALNPIGLVVVALVALAAALVYAYNHSETFRKIVQAAWQGIQTAAATAWAFLQGIFSGIGSAVSAVGQFFTDLWQKWIVPAWDGITSTTQTSVASLTGIWDGIKAGVAAVGAVFTWLWQSVIVPVWNDIVNTLRTDVATIVTVILTPFVVFYQNVLGPIFTWLWQSVIVPAWNGIKDAIGQAWAWILANVFQPIVNWINGTLVPAATFLRDQTVAAWNGLRDGIGAAWAWILANVWQPIVNWINGTLVPAANYLRDQTVAAWNVLRDGINAAWQWILANIWQPILNFIRGQLVPGFQFLQQQVVAAWNILRDGLNAGWVWIRDNIWNPMVNFVTQTIPQAFQSGVQAVARLWDGIKRALRDPVQAAIDVVYNRGIVAVWNTVARLVGIGGIATYSLPGFATGGPITGGVPGRDSVLVAAMPGEYVLSKPAVDRMGGIGAVDSFHSSLSGRGGGATATTFGVPGYQFGGAIARGSASTAAAGSAPAVLTFDFAGLWNSATGAVSDLAGRIGGTPWGQVVLKVGGKLVGSIVDYLKAKVASFIASITPVVGGVGGNVAGVGAVGGGGARAWIIAHESGGNPRAQNPTSSASGLYQMIDGTWRAYGGSTAHAKDASVAEQNAVADRYVAARYGSWENAQRFWMAHHYYDRGGYLMPGATLAYNGTGRPERVLPPDQTRALDAILAAVSTRGGGRDGGPLLTELQEQNKLLRALRGDVDQGNHFGALMARLDMTNRLLASLGAGSSVGATAQGWRTAAELGAWT